MDFPIPVIASPSSPKTKADEEKLGCRSRLALEDPTFKVNVDAETTRR